MTTNTIAINVADAFIAQAKGTVAQERLELGVTAALKAAFITCKTPAEFLALFGTGGNNKLATYVAGEIDTAFRAKLAKQVPTVQKKALAHFKSEMSNCRKVKALGLALDDKGARATLNEHRKEQAKANPPAVITTTPETPTSTDWTMLGKTASMEDVSNFVSAYVAHHGMTATRALAAQLKDFMPITVQRTKQAS
jgi:hypothetical protein